MAIFNHERKNGIQLGTVSDECMECKKKHRGEEDYEPESLDYKPVYKVWINNISHCMCLDCFKKTLGEDYILLATTIPENAKMEPDVEDEKPKANNKKSKKKEDDKNGGETA